MPPKKEESKAKHWCCTINNPTDDDEVKLANFEEQTDYIVVGREKGESGTPHLQIYFCLKNRNRLTALKKLLPRAHLEVTRGTPKEASDYCKKEGEFYEKGQVPAAKHEHGSKAGNEGNKRKWEEIWEKAKSGNLEEIDKDVLVPHYHAIKRIAQDNPVNVPDAPDVTGHWYYGPPRTGKSRTARSEHPNHYDKPCNKWWDGYKGEEVVILDDFDLNHKVLGHHLKRWTDRYSFPAEQKGTTVPIRPLKVIITSNYTPEEIWQDDPTLAEAVRARCTFKHFDHTPFTQ